MLYLVEPIDEVAIQNLQTYKEKKFVDISKEDLELGKLNFSHIDWEFSIEILSFLYFLPFLLICISHSVNTQINNRRGIGEIEMKWSLKFDLFPQSEHILISGFDFR